MADPLSIVGVVYPVARDLVALAKKLRRIYNGIRYAKQDLGKVIRRTNIVARTYEFFSETMQNVKQIRELASIHGRHGELFEMVQSESEKIIGRLKQITRIFWLEITGKSVDIVDKCIARFKWYKESKEAIPSLFQDMKVLEKSMKTIATLVNTQILLQAYESNRSEVIWCQIETSRKSLEVEVQKLKQARRSQKQFLVQHRLPPSQSIELKDFAQEILRIVEKGIAQLRTSQAAPRSPVTIDSRSPLTTPGSEVYETVTPPTIPPQQIDRDQAFEVEPEVQPEPEDISIPRQVIRQGRSHSAPPQHIPPLSPSPSSPKTGEDGTQDERSPEQEMHDQIRKKSSEGPIVYMQLPPFGPPRPGPRPQAGRNSPGPHGLPGSNADQK